MKINRVLYLSTISLSVLNSAWAENCPEGQILGVNSKTCINAKGECGDNCSYTLDENGTLQVFGSGPIKDHFFAHNQDITYANINNGITGIGWGAFYDMKHLEKINIPNSVVTMGAEIFQDTSPLNTIIIPESVNNETIVEGIGSWKNNYWYAGNGSIRNVYCTAAQIGNGICKNTATKYESENNDYIVYNTDGTIRGIYANYEDILNNRLVNQHDKKNENGNIIESYDGLGNLLKKYSYGNDGSIYVYDENGKLLSIEGKRIYTIDEATALVRGNKNTFSIKYR